MPVTGSKFMRIAVLLTCFNRKGKTKACLDSLYRILPDCSVYLVDDNSTDGTDEMIREFFPKVNLIRGNGNLFWSRGMFTAWKKAINGNYDYYLWINDDIELYPCFWRELMECYDIVGGNAIISGLIANKYNKNEILYGGSNSEKKLIQAHNFPTEIKFMNGNVVLVPNSVVNKIGIIDSKLHHDLGDVDYGLRAHKNGLKVYSTRSAVALGYPNGICRVRKWNSTLKKRFSKLYSPLGSPPSINFYFRRKHFGIINAIFYFIFLIGINIMPDWLVVFLWNDKYKDKILN